MVACIECVGGIFLLLINGVQERETVILILVLFVNSKR